ncbi:MAG: hypothetical protein WKF89_16580 [Chitinophagaceae bacterium]
MPKQFNDIIQRRLNIFAAWLPISNTYQLGDYGIIADGVFAKMGNIKELGISFTSGQGPSASIDFTSDSTRVINIAAGAEVDVIPEGALNAKVTYKFEKERSFLVKSPSITVNTIENINEVGTKLIGKPKWQKRFKVVHESYLAKEAVIMSTIEAGTEITFSGNVKALQQLNIGNVSVSFTSRNKLGFDLQGAEGIIGLGLFQLVKGGFLGLGAQKVQVLDDEDKEEPMEIQKLSASTVVDDL